jgi:hypothetical protein
MSSNFAIFEFRPARIRQILMNFNKMRRICEPWARLGVAVFTTRVGPDPGDDIHGTNGGDPSARASEGGLNGSGIGHDACYLGGGGLV